MTTYELLKFLHVMAAIAWIGAGIHQLVVTNRLLRGDRSVALGYARLIEAAGQRYFAPLAVLTLVFGVWMVLLTDAIGFGETWITIGFGGIALSVVTGAVLIGRTSAQLVEDLEADVDEGSLGMVQDRLRAISAVDVAILTVVVWAMIAKPGA